jgi:hypothetical protein
MKSPAILSDSIEWQRVARALFIAAQPRFAERKESFVAVQTLPSRPRSTFRHRSAPARVAPQRCNPTPAKMQEVEEQLLAGAMAAHPGHNRGIAHLLSDVEKGVCSVAGQRLAQLPDAAQVERIEDLLMEAVMRTHPNRGRAIDRLLGDVVGDAAIDDTDSIASHMAAEMSFDNDFDGLA